MDASRLRELAEKLIATDTRLGVQPALNNLGTAFSNFVQNAAHPQFQSQLSSTRDNFVNSYEALRASFTPSEAVTIRSLGGAEYFLDDLGADIGERMRENSLTPVVVNQYIGQLFNNRQQYIQGLVDLISRLQMLGITGDTPLPGDAEIGFKLPRELFSNNLEDLIAELSQVRLIIRAFSEAATGSVEPIVVRQISTTDPIFFFQVAAQTISAITDAVKSVLSVRKDVEEIRLLREKTRSLSLGNDILELLVKQETAKIESSIETFISRMELLGDAGRNNELENHLRLAMRSLYARIERGMTLEIRCTPDDESEDASKDHGPRAEALKNLEASQAKLVFAPPSSSPIIPLPRSTSETPAETNATDESDV